MTQITEKEIAKLKTLLKKLANDPDAVNSDIMAPDELADDVLRRRKTQLPTCPHGGHLRVEGCKKCYFEAIAHREKSNLNNCKLCGEIRGELESLLREVNEDGALPPLAWIERHGGINDNFRTRIQGLRNRIKTALAGIKPAKQKARHDNCQLCRGKRGGVLGNENIVDLAGLHITVCDYCHSALMCKIGELLHDWHLNL